MTVKLSQQTISGLLKYYFAGMTQPAIAQKVGTDQSTISLYAKRFSERAAEIGLLAAAKEYNVYKEASELRNLSVEMQKCNLTTEDAREGVGIIKTFSKLGVPTDQHTKLIKVCSKIDQPGFTEAALKLVRIETEASISYEGATSRFEEVTIELPVAESKLKKTKANLRGLNSLVDKRKEKLVTLEDRLTQLEKETETKRAGFEYELKNSMKQLKVRQEEIKEVARLKAELRKQGLAIQTLTKIAKELSYGAQKVDTARLRQAIQEFGSFKKAVDALGRQKESLATDVLALEQRILLLEHDLQIKERTTGSHMVELNKLGENIRSQLKEQDMIMDRINRRVNQYKLFESLVAMLLTSPSRKGNLMELATQIAALSEKGCELDESPGQFRLFFVYTVMGEFLHCYRCDGCGTKFITNKEPKGPIKRPNCPVCSSKISVKGDGSFVEALSNANNTTDQDR